jgi:UDP-N-acetylglucosamine:LPS N-acetylglucosamine transferase
VAGRKRLKVLVIVSGGGHFEQGVECLEAFRGCDVVLVCYRYLGELKGFSHPLVSRVRLVSLLAHGGRLVYLSLAINAFQFLGMFLRERPDILFSTGSEIAIPPFIMGKLLWRTKNIYLETAAGERKGTVSARVLYRWSDLFLVQWPHQVKEFGPRARYEGRIV